MQTSERARKGWIGGAWVGAAWLVLTAPGAWALTVTVLPSQDAVIYGAGFTGNANGAGEALFAGNTGGGSPRRSLLQFDLGAIPDNATITGAALTLFVDQAANATARTISLFELTQAWTTGSSNAVASPGQGVAAQAGDATWLHRSFPGGGSGGALWATQGGTFDPAVVASASVGAVSTPGNPASVYTWAGPGMVASVQGWLDDPATNFGWILVGNESATQSVKRFVSGDAAVDDWLKPNLRLTYDLAPPIPEPSTWALLAGGLLLVGAAGRRRRSASSRG
jgi:hypothetical protein